MVSPALTEGQELGGEAGWVARLKRQLPKAAYEAMEVLYSIVDFFKMVAQIARFRPQAIYERYQLFFPSGVLAAKLSAPGHSRPAETGSSPNGSGAPAARARL